MAPVESECGGPILEEGHHSKELIEKYKKVVTQNIGIPGKISRVTISGADLKGEHMASVIELVRVEFEEEEEEEDDNEILLRPCLDFFVKKRLPNTGTDPSMTKELGQMVANEGYFLKDFSHELKQLCQDTIGSGALIDGLLPKVYYYDDEMIVMENLVKKGYINLRKQDRQDFDHAKLVLENLARLHGVSHVLIQKEGGHDGFIEKRPIFEEPFLKPGVEEFFSKAFEPGYGITLQVLKTSEHPEKDKIYDILQKYQGQLTKPIFEAVTNETLFHVVNHPDCWNNNIMFDGPGPQHDKLVFVDFQVLRCASPNIDIAYFIYTSAKGEVRRRWKELLKIYFDRLAQIVTSLGQSFDFDFEDFVADYVRKSKLGFFFGLFMLLTMEAMGAHDADAGVGFTEDIFTKLITNWVAANPVKAQQISEEMISLVHDYQLFGEL